jgi:subtilisin family serine protease
MKLFYKAITSAAITTTAALGCLAIKAEASTLRLGQSSTSNVGLTTSQGDVAMRADIARNLYGVDGSGILIGVISDSFNNLGGAESDIASGDLPSGIQVLQDFPSGGKDEGRAIMQLIHDVAPGANFLFHTPSTSQSLSTITTDYANAIRNLADAGARIIVSDVGDPSDPMFQDGIVAQAIDSVVNRPGTSGVSFFAAAGNEGRRSYESAFNPSGVIEPLFGGEFHDFDPGSGVDTFQRITIPSDSLFNLFFQWDSPFASVSGGVGSPNDLNIFLYDSTGTNVLAGSAESNIGNDPAELFSFFNEGLTSEFNLAISKQDGPSPGLMKYIIVGGGRDFEINEFDTASSTIFGYANARGAMAVGAASYLETPAFGTDPARLRFFSSAGSTPILFDTAGNRLASPEIRRKPGIVAPDGTNTTFFIEDIPEDPDDFPNFPGTSAAAPHAAAVAALMLQANPLLSPYQIYSILENTALDMDDPSTPGFDEGFDFASGYGLIQADRALSQATASVPEPSSGFGMLAFGALGAASLLKRKLKKQKSASYVASKE